MPLSLVLAAIATASAPAGTVAVIKEYKARGPLTQALYAVVGFDDGLGIIIFGFAVAAAKLLLSSAASAGTNKVNFLQAMVSPFKEVLLSIILGVMIAYVMSWFLRFFTARSSQNIFILIFGTILIATGLSNMMHLSLILTNMVIGIIIVNTQPNNNVETIKNEAASLIPLLFVFFFSLAGASLHIGLLPSLGMLSIVYIAARSAGKISGSWIGAVVGKCSDKLKKFIGIGILSQAGLAIGLALIIKHEFNGLGPVISKSGLPIQTWGDQISGITIATVTATCIIFEILGPVLARYALLKAGEIKD
jgi:Kef-type K+ transport system membrane component KefB